MTQDVIFIRHGVSVANVQMWLSGQTDPPLTPAGTAAARALSQTVLRRGPVRVLSSDLARARTTAELMLGEASPAAIETTAALRERHYGDWEGLAKAKLDLRELQLLLSWTGRPPNGESLLDAGLRAARELAQRPPRECLIIVAHEGVLRTLLAAIDGRLGEAFTGLFPHTTPIERRLPARGWPSVRDELARASGAA